MEEEKTNLLYDSGGYLSILHILSRKRDVLASDGWIFEDVLTKSLCIENGISDRR
jgi:hypothetical protein